MNIQSQVIEVHNLHKKFGKGESEVQAVNGISLVVNKGEIFGFLGPNGAGKTTSIQMMIGLMIPDEGNVKILGEDVLIPSSSYKKKISIIPQDIVLYPDLTVEENLRFIADLYNIPKKLANERISNLLENMDLLTKRKSLARNLSGGLKRRLNLILGLMNDPDVVFCDEPTPGLDPQSRLAVWEVIKSLPKKGKTVILTTHFMEEADRLCDRVAIIDHGELLIVDTPEQLKKSIGEGDMVEISLQDQNKISAVTDTLGKQQQVKLDSIKEINEKIIIRGLNLIPQLNRLLGIIEKLGQIIDIKLRKTSLEDVFIELTGKKLRD